MAKPKRKTILTLGKKKWATKRTSLIKRKVTVEFPEYVKSPVKRLTKRLFSPSKSPLYKPSPASKRIKSFISPIVTPKRRINNTNSKSKSYSRSLFGQNDENCNINEGFEYINDDINCEESQTTGNSDKLRSETWSESGNINLLPEAMKVLSEEGLDKVMSKFLNLVKDRKFPLNNIAFLLWMEVVRWFDCKSTTQMRYSDKTKMFWKLGWRMFGGRFIHFMGGYKNREEIVLGMANPGTASPETSLINFAIPDLKVLRAHDKYGIAENWTPGINTDIMRVIGESLGHKSACLTYDGKKVKQGLTENSGDVDLIGYEAGQTLEQKKDNLQKVKEEVNIFCRSIGDFEQSQDVILLPDHMKRDIKDLLLKLLKRLSTYIIQVEDLKRRKDYCKEKLIERSGDTDWRKGKYVYAISAMMAFLYDIEQFLSTSEMAREKICRYISYLNQSKYVQGKTLNLREHQSYVELPAHDDEEANSRLIKQRTNKWFEIRRKAKVTGSTLYKALGFEGLNKEKDHYENVVCGVPEKEPSENAKSAMKHGTDNEENAVATIVGKVMPVLYPGATFFEEGCVEVLTEESKPFLVVSPDGSLRRDESFESTFAGIEIKCPVMKIHTEFPPRYLLQCLSEIEVLHVDSLIYISWTGNHSNVFKVERDQDLFRKAMKIAYNIYNTNNKKPTKLSDEQKRLKSEIIEKAKHVEFIGTFSSVMSESSKNVYSSEKVSVCSIVELLTDVNTLSTEHYELNRERASEAVVFIVADLDRSWEKEKIRCAPVAWFPKGYSLHTNTMRSIADDVHTMCHEHNIHIPCESFDGQWHGIVVRSRNDQPLTILQLQKNVWQEVEKTSKSVIVSEIKKANCSPKWEYSTICRNGIEKRVISTICSGKKIPTWRPEVKLGEQKQGEHKVDSEPQLNCNTLLDVLPPNVANNFETSNVVLACATIDDSAEKEAFATNVDEETWAEELEELLDFEDSLDQVKYSKSSPENVHEVQEIKESTEKANEVRKESEQKESEHYTKRIQISSTDVECILSLFKSTKNCNNKQKWTHVDSSVLHEYFTSTKQLNRFLDVELRVIVKYLKKTKAIQIKESNSKRVKIEELAKYLGLDVYIGPQKSRRQTLKTLKDLAGHIVSKLPKHELNVTYAEFIWTERFDTWKLSTPVPTDPDINGSKYSFFYMPEFNEKRQQLEVKCIDSTHLLTRTRRKICKGGIERLTNEPWLKVAKTGKTFLTPIMIQEITDPMSMDMAVTQFSETVESVMRENGDDFAADLCHDIRNWWESEDKAGIPASVRICQRAGLRRRLLSYVDFGRFPPPGSHINGWPQQLWEALLANMDAKILLYPLCHGGSYNTRAFSSMIGETFFSELTMNDKRGQGTVTCEEFGRFICNSIEQLQMRLDPERSFAYSTKRATAYRLVEDTDADVIHGEEGRCNLCENKGVSIPRSIVTKNHMFDTAGRKRLPGRRRQGTISTSRNAIQKGALGVRWEKARTNESKMLPTKRMGLD